jgi:hypothetical protein
VNLRDPDSRRGLRSVVHAIVALALIGLLYWLTGLLRTDIGGLRAIARGALLICGLDALLYGAENVTRAVNFKFGPVQGGIGGGDA